ncbi:MAG: PKD domain-containing protein [Salibacteraceae bacterium]
MIRINNITTVLSLIGLMLGSFASAQNCRADFDYTTDELFIECRNTSTGQFTNSLWDFGDGSLPSLDDSHTYDEAGEYEVCLTIGNLVPFCTDEYCETIEVYEYTCDPGFSYTFDPDLNLYSFTNTTADSITGVKWEFGDGNTSTFENPTYSYNEQGVFQVCLTTYEDRNICGFYCEEIEVFPLGIELNSTSNIKLFPNPSSGEVQLTFDEYHDQVTVRLFDLSGSLLQSREHKMESVLQMNFDVPAGFYIVQVSNADQELGQFRLLLTNGVKSK